MTQTPPKNISALNNERDRVNILIISRLPASALNAGVLSPEEHHMFEIIHEISTESNQIAIEDIALRMRLDDEKVKSINNSIVEKSLPYIAQTNTPETPIKQITAATHTPTPIPKEMLPLWIRLSERGAPIRALTKFEAYLAGDTPMTEEQKEAGARVMAAFPDAHSIKYNQLTDFIANTLHDRYQTADDEEKKKIHWVANSLFSARFDYFHKGKFDSMVMGAGENYSNKLQEKIEIGVEQALASPAKCNIMSLMNTIVKRRVIDLQREIIGREHEEHGNLAAQHHMDRINIVNPASIHDVINRSDGTTLEDNLVSADSGTLDVVLKREALRHQEKITQLLRDAPATIFSEREREFLKHYMKEFDTHLNGSENIRLEPIADKMGVSYERAYQYKNSIFDKVKEIQLENAENHTIKMSKGRPPKYGELSALGDIKLPVYNQLSTAERRLVDVVTSMPEEEVTLEVVSKQAHILPRTIRILQFSIEKKSAIASGATL